MSLFVSNYISILFHNVLVHIQSSLEIGFEYWWISLDKSKLLLFYSCMTKSEQNEAVKIICHQSNSKMHGISFYSSKCFQNGFSFWDCINWNSSFWQFFEMWEKLDYHIYPMWFHYKSFLKSNNVSRKVFGESKQKDIIADRKLFRHILVWIELITKKFQG